MLPEVPKPSLIKKLAPTSIDWNRALSLWLSIAYLFVALVGAGGSGFFQMFMYLVIPMACIWYGDAMGSISGGGTVLITGWPALTKSTPGCIMIVGGWLILLLPIIRGVIVLIGLASE